MIELWKLPKAERTLVESTVAQLKKAIGEFKSSIDRHNSQIKLEEMLLNAKEIELSALCNKHNIHD